MNRRELVLSEIGYRPLWKLRAAAVTIPSALPLATPMNLPKLQVTTAVSPIQPQPISEALDNSVQAPAPPYENPVTATPITDWDDLQQQINVCQQCQLAGTRTNIVVGRGNQKARLLLIGEAPGEQEDRQGLPFVGKAGQLLENMLAAAGIDSEREVYICNLLKCRPPGNRNPAPDEISKCSHFLQWQIDAVQPELIVAVGRFAAQSLLQEQASLSSLRGKLHQYGRYPVLVSFHPAYLLRSPGEKAKAWQDWCRVHQLLNQK